VVSIPELFVPVVIQADAVFSAHGTDRERTINAWVQQNVDPWTMYLDFWQVSLGTEWQQYEISALAEGSDAAAAFVFGLGERTGTVWLDGVRLQSGSRDIWRRDYQGGIALVNATHSPQTVPLGGAFRKINGTQAPEVNDGSLVAEVTLAPLDGLILLRETEATESVYLPLVTRTSANSALPWLHVEGAQILDESGNPVTLGELVVRDLTTGKGRNLLSVIPALTDFAVRMPGWSWR